MDFKQTVALTLQNRIEEVFGEKIENLQDLLETPPQRELGDYAFPCFRLSRTLRKAPPAIAAALCENFPSGGMIGRVENVGGYLNFFLDRERFAQETVEEVLSRGDRYASSEQGKGKTVVLDYSSINIAKRFHIGHLSTTMLGHSLKRIYEHLGYTTVGVNHLGDWGTQFGKMVAAYLKWGDRETVEKGGVDEMVRLYVRFNEEAEKDPDLNEEGRYWFRKIEEGDPTAMEIYTWFKEVTLKDAQRVYDMLGVKFDSYAGESFYIDKVDRVIEELEEKHLLKESQGAYVVDLEEDHMPPFMVRKNDGTTLYATRDLAAALYRADTYHFDKCLYVVAYQQDLHFRQLFKVIEKMGYPWYKDMVHVNFGMVSFEGETLSTRHGRVVYLDDLLEQSVAKALEIIREKSPDLENKEETAKQVGIGAVVFYILYNSRIKDVDFWWDRALNFDGETGPYVQYTHARCSSVLEKASYIDAQPDWAGLDNPEVQEVVRAISDFTDTVREAAERYEPSMISRQVMRIAQAYNKFYYEHRIADENNGIFASRVLLTRAAREVIRLGLFLIGIQAPDNM